MAERFSYPEARRDETCIDIHHGIEIKDPYRWLEDPKSDETIAFIDAQNDITRPYLDSYPHSGDIRDRLKDLWDFPKYSCPKRHGDKYYYYINSGLQNQSVLYVQDTLESEPRVFFDPNTLSDDGTVAITSTQFSPDGSIFGYGLSVAGAEWNTIQFINTQTGEKYPEVLEKVKYSPMTWTRDNAGVFYGMYTEQEGDVDGSDTAGIKNQKLCYHRIGTPQSEDVLVIEFPEEPLWRIGAQVTDCGNYLIITPIKDCRDNLLYYTEIGTSKDITGKLTVTKIVDKFEADYDYITNNGKKMIFRTNKNAPNYRLICIDLDNKDESQWTDLIPADPKRVLDWTAAVDHDKLLICYGEDVKDILELYDANTGKYIRTFSLDLGSISGFGGDYKYSEIFYQFTSFLTPGIIYTIDLSTNLYDEPKVFREIKVDGFNPKEYKTSQVFYSSKDGTKIPMFIVSRADIVKNGQNPALLYGYGGFNISIQPVFSVTRLVFIQSFHGIFAVPNIRGGGEYGETWHNSGRLMNKQNVFDDFQSAGEFLIEQGYTCKEKLSIQGGSNGGLLVAACINQRPDLFGAAIASVPVIDMLRFHKFTVGYAWISDYGTSENENEFKNMIKYSPLHNIKIPDNNVQYPATLLLTADHDDLVVPLHSLKMIATLQWTLGKLPQQTNPLLARIETNAGHGRGKPTSKIIEESTDILSFIAKSLNLKYYKE
ncbi:hypothetical protein PV325_011793 [Microctonus aethiopoides]|uniref:Prolyl endopeptidase n=1 Tax=Microctonus aethiopoides TaxID=144406 RepID=A0AA39C8Y8_9HYME|nr:hypothetical protein PV325_011793 [Microctonus aethiopoides]KAK0097009.1 hypothetical protein PV326_003607 [Microctonus aethiopoides]KAK0160086.1 hypothetical protein PV328_007529 [Microctonus aethiopoides]